MKMAQHRSSSYQEHLFKVKTSKNATRSCNAYPLFDKLGESVKRSRLLVMMRIKPILPVLFFIIQKTKQGCIDLDMPRHLHI